MQTKNWQKRYTGALMAVLLIFVLLPANTVFARHNLPEYGNYTYLGDINMYYTLRGQGPAIVFIHGGFATSTQWDWYAEQLKDKYTCIAIDSRGFGRTGDGNGPITYQKMGEDVIKLLNVLGICRAHFVGHSDGGIAILSILRDHYDRIISASLSGTPYNVTNYPVWALPMLAEGLVAAVPEPEDQFYLDWYQTWLELNPKGEEYWPTFIEKLKGLWLVAPYYSPMVLETMNAPVWLLSSDADPFIPYEVYELMLSVMPDVSEYYVDGANHGVVNNMQEQYLEFIKDALEATKSPNTNKQLRIKPKNGLAGGFLPAPCPDEEWLAK